MAHTAPAGTTDRRTLRASVAGLVVIIAAIIGTLVYQSASSSASSSGAAHPQIAQRRGSQPAPSSAPALGELTPGDGGEATSGDDGVVTEGDGVLPADVTVFDDQYPGVANLDPALLRALREAAGDAADDGVAVDITSGWRSPTYQDLLLREAVSRYGSAKAAARWVATADTSAHVSGHAVDVGPVDATTWLSRHGAHYGLCQIYRNESWHYELRPEAIEHGCPPMYADPAHDPSLRQ
jgi:hypothetical protein